MIFLSSWCHKLHLFLGCILTSCSKFSLGEKVNNTVPFPNDSTDFDDPICVRTVLLPSRRLSLHSHEIPPVCNTLPHYVVVIELVIVKLPTKCLGSYSTAFSDIDWWDFVTALHFAYWTSPDLCSKTLYLYGFVVYQNKTIKIFFWLQVLIIVFIILPQLHF